MKRERKSTLSMVNSTSISDLPASILVDITLRLSLTSIGACKSVCKAWHSAISSPEFAKLHWAQSSTGYLLKEFDSSRFSRSVYLVEHEDGLGLCWCESSSEDMCARCAPTKVTTRLELPLKNPQYMFNHLDNNPDAIFSIGEQIRREKKREHLVNLFRNFYTYKTLRFCNGFICLGLGCNIDPFVICNPITDEFLYLPNSCLDESFARNAKIGFGYSPKTNSYKLLRMFIDESSREKAEILVIGTDSWRNVDISAFKYKMFSNVATYFKGSLHWILTEENSQSLASFDVDEEQFALYSVPSLSSPIGGFDAAVLGGFLCVYHNDLECRVHIWAMKEYGVSESWTKLFCVDASEHSGLYLPLSILNDGALVMYNKYWHELVYYDRSRGLRFKHIEYDGFESYFRAFAYTPSFFSLKEIVPEVLNISRYIFNSVYVQKLIVF